MTRLALIRHAMTAWNLEKRIQGRIDQPLCERGRQQLADRALPASFAEYRWFCSPLLRAMQSAELLGLKSFVVEPALVEMDWGAWEGEILKPLRNKLGEEMRANERLGLDFMPPGGESPRQVQARLRPWLRSVAESGDDSAAVVHKGIIRCVYALAFDWDMRGESPVEFAWDAIHEFELGPDGRLQQRYRAIPLSRR